MRKILIYVLPAAVIIGVAAAIYVIVRDAQPTWRSDSPHDELIGISYGDVPFNEPETEQDPAKAAIMRGINGIQKKIYQENQRVAQKHGRYVKVALLTPLTVSKGKPSAIPLDQIEHTLQGTYTALIRANHTQAFGDSGRSEIQLLLVNQGSRQEASDRLMDKVRGSSEEEHPLVTVIGLGSSVGNTEMAVEKLGTQGEKEERIPMVSAITSADSLTGKPGFWSVSPSNMQYVQAIEHYFSARKDLKSAVVVEDVNEDPYTASLAEDFRTRLGRHLYFPPQTYNGRTLDQPATANDFAELVTNLCTAANDREHPLDAILYAGRVTDFEPFARALAVNRSCSSRLTILAAATGFASAQRFRPVVDDAKIDVFFASPANPPAWTAADRRVPDNVGAPVPGGFADFLESYKAHGFPVADLNDGMAIAHYDALATSARAIRMGQNDDRPPRPVDVAQRFSRLVLAFKVDGASGTLSFPETAKGRAVERFIPIVQLGRETQQDKLPEKFTPYEVR
jgi:hypothetical protein